MNFLTRFIQRRKQSTRMQALKEQQRLLRSQSRSTKFTTKQPTHFRQPEKTKKSDTESLLRQFFLKDGLAICGIGMIILGGAYIVIFNSNQFVLANIEIQETQFISKQEIEQATQTVLNRSTLGIPRNNYWTIRQEGIEASVKKALSSNFAVKDLQVTKDYPNTVKIAVTERIPSVTWITKDAARVERFYTIDHTGVVTKETMRREDVDAKLPQIEDKNRPQLGIHWQITSTDYIDTIIQLQEGLVDSGWSVQSFIFPAMTCEEQEYVAQQIFADEIKDSVSEKFKEKKRLVQEQFKKGDLGIEESLEALEDIKKEELAERDTAVNGAGNAIPAQKLEWATVDKAVACDYVQVASDVHVLAKKGSERVVELKFDTTRDIEAQLGQLQTVINQGSVSTETVKSIDLRIKDRVYYK